MSSSAQSSSAAAPRVLVVGSGEYATGWVNGTASTSDKSAGVVCLCMFDLRRRGKISAVSLAATDGFKYPAIREHLQRRIGDVYKGMDCSMEMFPADNSKNPTAYLDGIKSLSPGDLVVIFTPDDTHFDIAMAAIDRGCHVMVTKPAVQTLEHHEKIVSAAAAKNVLVMIEVHKRYDAMYWDARQRAQVLGPFSYFYSYMSQPKKQLETFKSWAGVSSDISYYLNSHHVDWHVWSNFNKSRPTRVVASGATGVASKVTVKPTEDVITLTVTWENFTEPKTIGTAVYTASWIAAPSDVHSQQRFFYTGHEGEIMIDQAHRGYFLATDEKGLASVNPLYMRYTPDSYGFFAGQEGYGYKSFEKFVDAAQAIRRGEAQPSDFDGHLPTMRSCYQVTAILEAGRISLDHNGSAVTLEYEGDKSIVPIKLTV